MVSYLCISLLHWEFRLVFRHEIRSAVLIVHGEKTHSRYFSEGVGIEDSGCPLYLEHLKVENKELMIISGVSYVDLYDHMDMIPLKQLEEFFKQY